METDRDYNRLLKRVSANIRKFRKIRELTQEDMADFGFNYRHFQKLESGTYSFSLHTLHRLAKVLKVTLQDLLD